MTTDARQSHFLKMNKTQESNLEAAKAVMYGLNYHQCPYFNKHTNTSLEFTKPKPTKCFQAKDKHKE